MFSGEFAVPGKGAELDASGNIAGKTFTRILSQLKASRDPNQNMTPKSRKRAVRSAGGQYFVLRKGKVSGVFQRTSGRSITPILLFVRAPQYKQLFDFYGVGARVFAAEIQNQIRSGFEVAMASRKKA